MGVEGVGKRKKSKDNEGKEIKRKEGGKTGYKSVTVDPYYVVHAVM